MSKLYHSQDKELLIQNTGFRQYYRAKQWAEYNRKFFNDLAPKYDYLNQVMTLGMQNGYKLRAMKRLSLQPGDQVLDIATGSGDMAFLAADLCPQIHVTGVDVAENMLEVAEKRGANYPNIKFQYADAMFLPFADASFDVTLSSYGLRNYADLEKGIREMIRVTKPGGQIMTIDLGKPQSWFDRTIYNIYFEKVMPFLGKYVFHRGEFNSFQYLPESNKYFPEPETLKSIMADCGIKDIKTYSYMNGIVSQQIGYV